MDARLNLFENPVTRAFFKRISAASRVVAESSLPAATQELVKLRASQINGCGYCTDMHSKDAAHAGESQQRIHLVAAWREATVFTEAERAALELAEQGTRIADAAGGVTDEAWANAAKHFDDEQLGCPGVSDRRHQHLEPPQRHHPPARRGLRARPVALVAAQVPRRRSALAAAHAENDLGGRPVTRSTVGRTCDSSRLPSA